MDPSVKTLLLSGAQLTDAALERLLPSPDTLPHSIHRAMRHSVFAGGKRLRPILCMEAARMVATLPHHTRRRSRSRRSIGDAPHLLPHPRRPARPRQRRPPPRPANLPQSLRRSHRDPRRRCPPDPRLPHHRQPLLLRLHHRSHSPRSHRRRRHRCRPLEIQTALPPGMIGGQVVDIESEGTPPTAELVESIHRAKTGALITTSIVSRRPPRSTAKSWRNWHWRRHRSRAGPLRRASEKCKRASPRE